MITRITAFLVLALLGGNASAASFDCTKASTFAEKEICRDGYLSGLDELLSDQYRRSYAQAIDKQTLLQSQREWLATRDQCNTQKCLDSTISERIQALKMYPLEEREQAEQQAQAEIVLEQTPLENQAWVASEQALQVQNPAAQYAEPQGQQIYNVPIVPTYGSDSYVASTWAQERSWFSRFFDSPAWKWTLLAMAIITLTVMYLHHSGSATVYIDYTDAAITNGLPLIGLIFYLVGAWLELPDAVRALGFYVCIIAALVFGLYTAFLANGFGVQFVLVVIAKLTLVSVFYALVAFLLLALMPTKYKDETRAQADARSRRSAREAKIQIAALSVGYTFLTRWLCRYGEFSSVSETLSYTPSQA